MEYCSDQQMRKYLYESYNGRASYLSKIIFENNSETIKSIINQRLEKY